MSATSREWGKRLIRYMSIRMTPKQHENIMRWAQGEPGAMSDAEGKALVRYVLGKKRQ